MFTTLIKQLCFLIFKKDCLKNSAFLIFLDDKNYENTIISAYHILKWQGVSKKVLAFGDFLSEENKKCALKLLENYNFSFCEDMVINNKFKDIFNE